MQRIQLSVIYLQKDQRQTIKVEVGQITFLHIRKRWNWISRFMKIWCSPVVWFFFGTGVNGSRVKINNKIGWILATSLRLLLGRCNYIFNLKHWMDGDQDMGVFSTLTQTMPKHNNKHLRSLSLIIGGILICNMAEAMYTI